MTKKLVGTIAMALGLFGAQAQAAASHDSVYLRDSQQGAMELSNVPQGQGYKHLLDATRARRDEAMAKTSAPTDVSVEIDKDKPQSLGNGTDDDDIIV